MNEYGLEDGADGETGDLDVNDAAMAVEVLRMLADVTRLRLLWALLPEELSVNALADALGKPQSAVSQHLAKLRMAGLVQTRRDGNRVFYRIDSEHIRQLVRDSVHHAEHAAAGIPRHHQARVEGPGGSSRRVNLSEVTRP